MEHSLPDWNFDGDFNISDHKKPIWQDNELMEILWRDGQVVLQSQTQRKPAFNNSNEPIQVHTQGQQSVRSNGNNGESSNTFLEDEETVSWIQYPLDNPFEKEFSSQFFSQIQSLDQVEPAKSAKRFEEEKLRLANPRQPLKINHDSNNMPPPKFKIRDSKFVSFGDGKESSGMTVGPSHCGSNQCLNDIDITTANTTNTTGLSFGSLKDDVVHKEGSKNKEMLDSQATSSSGGSSACSFGRTSKEAASGVSGHKRKSMATEESESKTQAARNKSVQRRGTVRRSRAAEVHNLSERRRRDRINEKMRALQELIPQCSRTDKASILDEAIDYMKSLQLQLQVMWMGSGMVPMLFPGVQPYMSQMAPTLPSPIQNPMQMQHNPALVCRNPVLNPVHYQNQTQNPVFSDHFARYVGGFQQMQAASQAMNISRFGSQTAQHNQMPPPATAGGQTGPVTGGATTNNLPSRS